MRRTYDKRGEFVRAGDYIMCYAELYLTHGISNIKNSGYRENSKDGKTIMIRILNPKVSD